MPTSSMHTVFGSACRCAKVSKRVVIVLDERESLVGVDRVLDGLERFGPSVICWEHKEGANPPMVPFVRTVPQAYVSPEAPVAQREPSVQSEPINLPISSQPTPGQPTPSELRLVGEAKEPVPAKPIVTAQSNKSSGPITSSDVLNADELDALLAGELGKGRGK